MNYKSLVRYGARCKFSNQYVQVEHHEGFYFLTFHALDSIFYKKLPPTTEPLDNLLNEIDIKEIKPLNSLKNIIDLNENDLFRVLFDSSLYLVISKQIQSDVAHVKYINLGKGHVGVKPIRLAKKSEVSV